MMYKQLLVAIKKNKKYQAITDSVINKAIAVYFKQFPKQVAYVKREKSKQFKKIVSALRGELYVAHGSFQTKHKEKRAALLKDLPKNLKKILATNKSTKERILLYPSLYKQIFKITGVPKKILDLGCGMNPVSYPYMDLRKVEYYAYDIDEEDVDFVQQYFSYAQEISGDVGVKDLTKVSQLKTLPKADVAFLFKVLDPLERGKGHKLGEAIIKAVPAKWLVVSFATKTVSGKQMRHPYRGWIERLLERIELKYKKIPLKNEVFYIIRK